MMSHMLEGTILPDTHMAAIPETPLYRPAVAGDLFLPGKGYAKKADSGLTCNNNNMGLPSSRKRSRDYYTIPNNSSTVTYAVVSQRPKLSSSWFEQETAIQMQRQQRELDCLIAQHTQRMRLELEERARQQTKALASVIRETVLTKLREKDEEIQRIVKLNWGLQERIRNLYMENQLWRELAQTNEAAANSLRTDLERVMAGTGPAIADNDDAESCCGSNEVGVVGRRCKGCGGGSSESEGVVVMPCRHVLLECTRCDGSSRQSCPVCGSSITATLHVHLPSS